MPTVHFYKDGHLVESHVGVMQPQAVKDVKIRLNRANARFVRFLKRLCAKIKRSEKVFFYGSQAGVAQAVWGLKTDKKILQSHLARLQNFRRYANGFSRKT